MTTVEVVEALPHRERVRRGSGGRGLQVISTLSHLILVSNVVFG